MINKNHPYMLLETGKILATRLPDGKLKQIEEENGRAFLVHGEIENQNGTAVIVERKDEILATGRAVDYLKSLKSGKFKKEIIQR